MAWIKFPLPSELLVIVFGAVASYTMKLRETYDVATVHKVPVGFPQPQVPDMTLVPDILWDTFAIAVVRKSWNRLTRMWSRMQILFTFRLLI